MERKGLGKRINEVRKDRGFTADKLSELCNINATYLRQIEGGVKMPSLPVFIDICNALRISLIICFKMKWAKTKSAKSRNWKHSGKMCHPVSRSLLLL